MEMNTQSYSTEEVANNDGKNGSSVWIVIKNDVYDVTEFLKQKEHPGGNEILEEWGGKDATGAFGDVGHSSYAESLLKKFKIGEKNSNFNESSVTSPAEKVINKRRNWLSFITCGLTASS